MKVSRLTKWISVMLSAMLVLLLFPVQALAAGPGSVRNDPPSTDPVDIFTVTFFDWDGTELSHELVARGESATPPKHPEREGYTAAGWDTDYKDVQGNLTVTAAYELIEEDTSLFGALFAAKPTPTPTPTPYSITVNFKVKDTGEYIASYSFEKLTKAQIDNLKDFKDDDLLNEMSGVFATTFVGISHFDDSIMTANGHVKLKGDGPAYTLNVTLKIDIATTYIIVCKNTAGTELSHTTVDGKAGHRVTPTVPTFNGYTLSSKNPASGSLLLEYSGNVITFTYAPITYNITYELNDGTNAPTNPGTYDATKLPLTLDDPTRDDYLFAGWSNNGSIPVGEFGDKTFTASWTPITYSVTYAQNEGTGSVPVDGTGYARNGAVSVQFSPLPTRTGYDFLGWSTSAGATTAEYTSGGSTSFPMGTANVTLYAIWALHKYSVSYSVNEGTGSVPVDANTYVMNSTVPVLYDSLPTRAGYDFMGWATSSGATEATFVSGGSAVLTMGTEDITLYAVWALHGYSVSYSANGGTGSVPSDSNTYVMGGTPVVLFDSLPTRTGYTFKGWATSDSASEATFVSGGSATLTMGTADVTLYAVWSLNHYSISYTLNDSLAFPANNGSNPTGYTVLSDTIHLAIPTRTGYTFDHWDPAGTIEQGSTENRSFTAYWTANTYTITYNLNGGSNDDNNPKTYTASSSTIVLAPATRPGYTFLGWYVGSTPNSTIAAGSTGNKTFTAKWSTAIRYGITYTMNGGINYPFNPSYYTVNSATIHLQDPWRTGYDFAGWTPTNTIPQGSTEAKVFTATWTPITYEIHYNLNGGTNADENPATYTPETPTIHLADPTRAGYNFWFWLPIHTISQGSIGDRYVWAMWSAPINYNIKYNLGGGTNAASNPSMYNVNSDSIKLADPTRTGYTFTGWSPDGSIPAGSTGPREFTASWKPITYAIHYELGIGGVNAPENPSEYTIESDPFTLGAPTRTGYDFIGWDPAKTTIETGSHGDLAFTALWSKPIAYNIVYTLGGGVNASTNPATYTIEDDEIALAAPTRAGYTFTGWTPTSTIPAGSTGEKTFVATWSDPILYGVTYVMNGGVNATTNPATYTVESAVINLAAPTRAGYNFTGWTPSSTIPAGSTGEKTFVATWSDPILYGVTYVMNGGVNATTNPATYTVESAAINLAAPTRAGYTFTGWTPTASIPAGSTGEKMFVATWSDPIVYGVTYVMNGGVNPGANPATYTVESATINLAAPTRAGYNFTGWTPTASIPAGSTGGRTFTATWSNPIVYDITYQLAGGANAAGNPDTYTVVSGLITLAAPTRTGYDFLGWTPANTIPANSTGPRTFTATWSEPHVHTVTYIVSGGTEAGLDGTTPFAVYQDVAYGAPVPVPNDPAQNEFSFDGWASEIPAAMPDADITLYGTMTRTPVLQEIVSNEKTPLAGPTWSLLNLILTVLTALGTGSIIKMLQRNRGGKGTKKNTAFTLSTLLPTAGAIVAFLLTQITSGSMVFADRWSYLMGGLALLQGVLVALGLSGGAKKA